MVHVTYQRVGYAVLAVNLHGFLLRAAAGRDRNCKIAKTKAVFWPAHGLTWAGKIENVPCTRKTNPLGVMCNHNFVFISCVFLLAAISLPCLPLDKSVFTKGGHFWSTRPGPLLDIIGGLEPLMESDDH